MVTGEKDRGVVLDIVGGAVLEIIVYSLLTRF